MLCLRVCEPPLHPHRCSWDAASLVRAVLPVSLLLLLLLL